MTSHKEVQSKDTRQLFCPVLHSRYSLSILAEIWPLRSVKNSKNPKSVTFSLINDFMKLACHTYIIMDRIKANNREKPEKKLIFPVSVLKLRKKLVSVRFS